MKLARKIIALAIVLCTLGAMMIPGVSATETPASMTVDFVSLFNAAGIPADKYLQSYNGALATVYETYNFDFYKDANGTPVRPNALYAGGRYRGGKFLEIAHNDLSKYGGVVTAPFKFVAPGTGDYELSFVYGKAYSKDNGGDEIGAYIMEMPETPYTKYNVPAPTAEGILAKASLANPGVSGKVTSEGTAALVEGQEYLIIFYMIDAEEKAYANFASFSLDYKEPPFDPANNTDLVVNFKNDFNAAGLAVDKYLQGDSLAPLTNANLDWDIYKDSTGTPSKSNSAYPVRVAGNNKYFQMRSNSATEIGRVPIIITAPGTGEYRLNLTFGVNAQSAVRAKRAGAFIVEAPEVEPYTRYNIPSVTSAAAQAIVDFAPNAKDGEGNYIYNTGDVISSASSIILEHGKQYLVIFFIEQADTTSYADYTGFSLTEVVPSVSIGSTPYNTLNDALEAAVSGDTIKMGMDIFEYEVELPEGVILDLNGKTLNTAAITGTVIDSADGKGLIVTEKEAAAISTGAGQIALWDNNEFNPGYRVFNYEFANYGISAGEDNVTGVSKFIDLYEAERVLVANEDPANLDENGEVIQFKGDKRFKDVTDDLAALYADGAIDWRYEYSNQQYQMGRGGVCFSWGNKSLRQFGAGFSAIRIQAPGEGKVSVKVKTSSAGSETTDAGFDMYIVKASDIEAACADYAANFAAFAADPTVAVTETANAFTAAIAANEPVVTGVSNGEAYTGTFEFEAGVEYIVIFNNNGSVKYVDANGKTQTALHMNFQEISFTRQEKHGATQTFWSTLKFSNSLAYTLINTKESGIKLGFEMNWNGNVKFFEYDDATLAAWAADSAANTEATYGLYIRISGFEALTESGTLSGQAYMSTADQWIYASGDAMTYEFTV